MVAFSRLVAGLSAVTASLAAPAEVVEKSVEERGPHNFFLGPDHPLARRTAINYNQDYTTGGTVNFSPSKTGFNLNWNTQQDFVVGVGWQPVLSTIQAPSMSPAVLVAFPSTGGPQTPLVEYYVMETNIGISTGGSQKGTLTSDGGTYAIWENQRVNEPSIIGTATFNQYISIRQSARSSGTVTIQNHFDAWAKAGLNLGTMNFQVIAVESWSGSGSASQQVSNGGTGTGTPTSSSGSTGPTGPSGSCSALYGQCGGIGWNGPTCCSSGSCKVSNSYYSQCL
ncbi:uncharacterized protein TrAtP1_005255 [Trichoderma atroviride]|uniref:uncharacterized protein n=1 Tax=Hypocrea atroviridis TaxID=63577 RepID=UPI0033180DF1|nr:hypothetical protein TrAtP1_005255 [Trichoderma atroviride]